MPVKVGDFGDLAQAKNGYRFRCSDVSRAADSMDVDDTFENGYEASKLKLSQRTESGIRLVLMKKFLQPHALAIFLEEKKLWINNKTATHNDQPLHLEQLPTVEIIDSIDSIVEEEFKKLKIDKEVPRGN
ncbi:hypothetical protein Bhyg_01339 [Pseudolycoriella hygida]|uniref:Uncharacterized protein n=1 Tax=Pseudolycoriella hygida TaxID=35572 RepID=A0A9Q0NB19_9DIPT|nr:hypothetical protein Bhyg_01339 [Pseudolycoriella hygida]